MQLPRRKNWQICGPDEADGADGAPGCLLRHESPKRQPPDRKNLHTSSEAGRGARTEGERGDAAVDGAAAAAGVAKDGALPLPDASASAPRAASSEAT